MSVLTMPTQACEPYNILGVHDMQQASRKAEPGDYYANMQ